jgi:hypothetical protein
MMIIRSNNLAKVTPALFSIRYPEWRGMTRLPWERERENLRYGKRGRAVFLDSFATVA